jgi:hypothetical protein
MKNREWRKCLTGVENSNRWKALMIFRHTEINYDKILFQIKIKMDWNCPSFIRSWTVPNPAITQ